MSTKDKNKKTICTKNNAAEIQLPAEKVAEIAGVSVSLVNKIRAGVRKDDTPSGERVSATEEYWAEGSNLLISEIKKIVKL